MRFVGRERLSKTDFAFARALDDYFGERTNTDCGCVDAYYSTILGNKRSVGMDSQYRNEVWRRSSYG